MKPSTAMIAEKFMTRDRDNTINESVAGDTISSRREMKPSTAMAGERFMTRDRDNTINESVADDTI